MMLSPAECKEPIELMGTKQRALGQDQAASAHPGKAFPSHGGVLDSPHVISLEINA